MILMNSKKAIITNVAIFGTIIFGYVAATFFWTQPESKTISYETRSLQVPLQPLKAEEKAPITISQFRGHNLLVNFWASWCGSCQREMGSLEKLAQQFSGGSVSFVGIASSDTRDKIEQSGILSNLTFPQYLDEGGSLALALGIKTLPQTLLIDREGRVLYHAKQELSEKDLKIMEAILTELNGHLGVVGKVPEFQLQDSRGKAFSSQILKSKVWVADFVFTSCPNVCPLLTSKMREIQTQFKNNADVRFVSISVDPETDTVARLQQYEKKHGIDPAQWYFLRGESDKIKSLVADGFKLGSHDNPQLHSGKFVLVDQTGKIRGYYDPKTTEGMDKIKSDLEFLTRDRMGALK